MSQVHVVRVIGALVTDEGLRRRFAEDPRTTLQVLMERGVELSATELEALAGLDARRLAHFAEALDPRLQKSDLKGGCS